ncbi:TRAP transporter small permease [Pseudonocardia nematodicida]|uniref:TRAP transporter small permease n=1 Tax=Pseudonocardia nematodicida TaxID=1206997 RepID=A0ABV1KHF1_9PSEU
MTTETEAAEIREEEVRGRLSIEEWVIGSVLGAMLLILFSQVVARFVFGQSLVWSEEIARYLFIWMIFIGLGAVTLRGEHIAVEALLDKLSLRGRRVAGQVTYVILFAVNAALMVAATRLVWTVQDLGQFAPATEIPMWLVYVAVPLGLLIASARLIQSSVRLWTTEPSGTTHEKGI